MTEQTTTIPKHDRLRFKDLIQEVLQQALIQAAPNLNQLDVTPEVLATLKLERPRSKEHGDYAVNVSSLARYTKMAPPVIAQTIQAQLSHPDLETEVIGGFINLRILDSLLAKSLAAQVLDATPGKNEALQGERVLLEFVSANPTGPLHIGHGRWAALGDSIRRVMDYCGATVRSEFYINDAGVQIENLTQSLWRRCLEIVDAARYPFPEKVEDQPYPFYPGEYVIDLAEDFLKTPVHRQAVEQAEKAGAELPETLKATIRTYGKDTLLEGQKALLERFGVPFEIWYSETALHQGGHVQTTLEKLKASGYTFEQEGALWFKTTEFGDEKDRVLIKSDGSYTYLTADIAYHEDKFTRQNDQGQPVFNRIINIWGADHHGYIPRMRAAIQAMGFDPNQFEVLLGQLVNLIVDGEKTRMGKRRSMLTLEDVIDEVGVDATRFWMVSKSADTALDFDIQLAKSKTEDNPVFYVQYAHARCASIVRNATQEQVNVESGEKVPAAIAPEQLEQFVATLKAEQLAPLFASVADDARAKESLKTLIVRLDVFEDIIRDAARVRSPHLIARYCLDLSADFHSFYNVCRILTPDPELTLRRLTIILAIQKVLATGLKLLGVSAPESM